jgi:flagellar hook assembly protein FlgD
MRKCGGRTRRRQKEVGMRIRKVCEAVAGVVLVGLLAGGCLPGNDSESAVTGETLGVVFLKPTADRTVAEGTAIPIDWTAANMTGSAATLTIVAESRAIVSMPDITILEDFPLDGTGDRGSLDWDTTGASGLYLLRATLRTAAGDVRQRAAGGKITVDTPPVFEFTAPLSAATFDPKANGTLKIAWRGKDESGKATIFLDSDSNHTNSSGETTLLEKTLPKAFSSDPNDNELNWSGKDSGGTAVAAGTYTLCARLTDDRNDSAVVEGTQITVLAAAETGLKIDKPAASVTSLIGDPNSVAIAYRVNKTSDVLVDVGLDTDDNQKNGNEVLLIKQQTVAASTDPPELAWDGTDSDGVSVPQGMYKVYIAVSSGSGTPETKVSTAYIYRRSDPNEPLIAMLTPATQTSVTAGNYLAITWRDDDPSTDHRGAIRLVVSPSPDPTVTAGQIEILRNRDATADGVQDTYTWQVPASLATGTYYVIGFAENGTLGNASTAAGRVIVGDPNNP